MMQDLTTSAFVLNMEYMQQVLLKISEGAMPASKFWPNDLIRKEYGLVSEYAGLIDRGI
jgi:hypothetical protein